MSAKASELLEGDIGEIPAGLIPIMIGFVELYLTKGIVLNHHASWPDRTGVGKGLFVLESLLVYALAVFGVVTGIAFIIIGAVVIAPGIIWEWAVGYYRQVAFKTNNEELG